jgi:uncharacterized protein (TIGR02646 family)
MIKVERAPEPQALIKNGKKWLGNITQAKADYDEAKIKYNEAKAKGEKPESIAKFKTDLDNALEKYKHDEVRQILETMFYGKCAYCEAHIKHIDFGDIEHFYPKAKYPLEAIKWKNLLFACAKCNQEHKSDNFPLDIDKNPLFVNPCEDEPNDHFSFEFDTITKTALVIPKTDKGNATVPEKIGYGLNRAELVKLRSDFVEKLVVLAEFYNLHKNENAKRLLLQATQSEAEYAAFARGVLENTLKK